MNGPEVFMFTLCEVPALVRNALSAANWTMADVDAVVMHQANEFMLNHLARRLKIPSNKLIVALADAGNTSCASIPLAITERIAGDLQSARRRLLLVGFRAGLSWAATATCGPLAAPEVVLVDDEGCSGNLRTFAATG